MKYSMILALLAAMGWAGVATAEDDDSGMSFDDKLAACAACHGENGDKPLAPDYPVLAGQYEDYLAEALRNYRSGRRQHPIMNMQMEVLEISDADIEQLARHFSSRKGLVQLEN